jgi:hypothetical protein
MKKLVFVLLFLVGRSALAQSNQSPSSGTFADLAFQCSYRTPDHFAGPVDALDAAQSDGYARGYCFGVLTTAMELLKESGEIQLTTDSTVEKAREIVRNYLHDHPGESQSSPALTLRAALRQAWAPPAKH